MALTEVKVPCRDNYNYGVGVDLSSSSPMGMVVKGEIEDVTGIANARGAITKYHISRVYSNSDLETMLGIDAKANYGSGAFCGASARFEFVKNSKIQNSSLFMTITATVELASESIKAPTLVPAAAAAAGHPESFSEHYGNMFVRGITRGGLFVAVMQVNTRSSEESESVSSELKGAYGLFSAEAKVKFAEVQKKYGSEVQICVYHEGGPVDLTMSDIKDANQLYTMLQVWLKAFQDDPDSNARPYNATLAPITIAEGAPQLPNWAQIQHAQDAVVLCAQERSHILDAMNLMEFINLTPSNYDFVDPVTPADIAKAYAGYQFDLDLVEDAAAQAIDDPTKAMMPAAFAQAHAKPYPQGIQPVPLPTRNKDVLDILAAKGESIAKQDPLATELRNRQPEGPARRGFDIGMAKAESDTLPGPGKQAYGATLKPTEQEGYFAAVAFAVDRNRTREYADKGEAVANADSAVATARSADPSILFRLGFDVATGLFGSRALGAQGDTVMGPGKQRIRDELGAVAQRGFDAAMKFYRV